MGEKLKALWAKLGNMKVVVIILGIIALIVEFSSTIIGWLVKDSKKTVEEAKKTDETLAKQETAANTAADALVDKAKHEGDNKPPVDVDWYKK